MKQRRGKGISNQPAVGSCDTLMKAARRSTTGRAAPQVEADIFDLVKLDLEFRNKLGWAQHNKPLTENSKLDWMKELYDELLDACVYLRGALRRRENRQ